MTTTTRRPKLTGHIGAKVERKAPQLGSSRTAVAKFLGFDAGAMSQVHRGHWRNAVDADGNPPKQAPPLSANMPAAVEKFLKRESDPKLAALAAKYPQRSANLKAAKREPEPPPKKAPPAEKGPAKKAPGKKKAPPKKT